MARDDLPGHPLAKSRLESVARQLIDALPPGFARRPGIGLRIRILLLADEAMRLTRDRYARDKAQATVRWASIALAKEEPQGWRREDAEAFALESAYRLWRQVRSGP